MWRTLRPVEYRRRGWKSLLSILAELGISVSVIVATGCWDSPFIFGIFTPVIAAGFARGFWHALRIGVTGAFAIGLAAIILDYGSGIDDIGAWCGELLLTAVVASYGRRLMARAEEFRALNLSQLWRLNEANGLLVNLNRLAQDLPASFDFDDTVQSALAKVREIVEPDVCAVLTLDPVSPLWSVASARGTLLPESYTDEQLPSGIRTLARHTMPQLIDDLSKENPGLGVNSRSGLYVPLWAGPRQVGLLVIESEQRSHFGMRHATLLRDIAEPMALTIDNARWFDRLRARGAAQERNRIARDLHDRVGQEVAYVAFELDRLRNNVRGTEFEEDVDRIRVDARGIVRELRETLYDLRTDVSEEQGLVEVLDAFLQRVGARSTVVVQFDDRSERRLPLSQEREVWRIAQEAIVNAERHAEAGEITVTWAVDPHGAELTIVDDGVGFQSLETGGTVAPTARPSYGMTGMRERAESIGGLLQVTSEQTDDGTGGTTVRLLLGSRREISNPDQILPPGQLPGQPKERATNA
jgi:signal transduction histidine kinase